MNVGLPTCFIAIFGLAALGCGDDGAESGTGTTTGAGTSGTSAGSSGASGSSTGGGASEETSASATTSDTTTSADTGTSTGPGTDSDGGGSTSSSGGSETGAELTPCGVRPCDSATEICVERAEGGPSIRDCEPVPAGCEADRTCACVGETLCTVGLAECTDVDANVVFCDSGLD